MIFWDLFGEQGHPIRATVSEMGPLLLSRLMNLTEAQEGIINIAFRIADEEGLLLLDLKDLQALLANIAERADEIGAPLRQCDEAVGRRDPAHAADPGAAGRHAFLRRAGAADRRHHAHHPRRPRRDQRARRRQADDESRGSTRRSCCG